ncbi:MAG TPA: DciA family protein [Gaiellaceae bacterium]|jgi:predicted nucleic acid-binding Zn ribbon protein|nr:DciA family protein [Gaiellaceae bacterium]
MEPIGDELRSELARFGPQGGIGDTVAAWPAAVGEEIARHAWPARFTRDGTLLVNTRDAVWGFELTQRAAEISSRLPTKPKLKFAPGPLPEATPETPADSVRDRPEATLEQARDAAEWASAIDDEELRDLVARAARASLARAAVERPGDRSF